MLKYSEISSFEDRKYFLHKSFKEKGLYIVPDIKSKLNFQNFLLKSDSLIPADCILRAVDFYKELFLQLNPDYSIVPLSYLQFLFKTWAKKQNRPKAELHINIVGLLQTFLPILSHPSEEEFEEWLTRYKNKTSLPLMYPVIRQFWQELTHLKIVEKSLIKYLLPAQDLSRRPSPSITVDLSFSLDSFEADVFCSLSLFQPVTVLIPPPLTTPFFKDSHKSYSLVLEKAKKEATPKNTNLNFPVFSNPANNKNNSPENKTLNTSKKVALHTQEFSLNKKILKTHISQKKTSHPHQNQDSSKTQNKPSTPFNSQDQKIQVFQFPSSLNEIQFIAAQLRQGLESGRHPSELAVLAPDMEQYWPALKSYLKKEGLLVKKSFMTEVQSFPQIQKWRAALHLSSGKVSFADLEQTVFSQKKELHHNSAPYQNCSREKDIEDLKQTLPSPSPPEMTFDEFLNWSVTLWKPVIKKFPNPELDSRLQSLLKELALPFFSFEHKKVLVEDWIELLENHLSCHSFLIDDEPEEGIACLSLNAITSLSAKQVHLMGLNHEDCKTSFAPCFSEKEARLILKDLGFDCSPIDPHVMEYEVAHFIQHFKGPLTLSYSQTYFNEKTFHASRIWLLENNRHKLAQAHTSCVWNSYKQQKVLEIQQNSDPFIKPPADKFKKQLPQALSISELKDYTNCPFIFLSKNLFHLKDEPARDVDLSSLNQGLLSHELFHKLKKYKIKDDKGIHSLIESLKKDMHLMDKTAQPFYQEILFKQAKKFLENEAHLSQTLPSIQNIGTEVQFTGYWNIQKKELHREGGDVMISGRVDRVDLCDGELLIIDYKSSLNNINHASLWSKNKDVQMPLYMQAGSLNLIDSCHSTVSGAVYISTKTFDSKGFVLENSPWSDFFKTHHIRSKKDKINHTLSFINEWIQNCIEGIQQGQYMPKPLNKSHCNNCHWRQICRATHLH